MENFSDKLINEYSTDENAEKHSELYYKVLALRDNFLTSKKEVNGETYIPHVLEAEFFELMHSKRDEMLSSEIYDLTKEINDLVYYVLTNVEVQGTRNLMNGQTTYNASAVTEYGLHVIRGWAFGGGGELDHLYQHTGIGLAGTDFILDVPDTVQIFIKGEGLKEITIPAGTKIDAKDYKSRESADNALIKNTDGSLGHFGDTLFLNLFLSKEYYLTKNIAGAPQYRLIDFSIKTERKRVSLSVDEDNILIVDYFK